MAYTVSAQNCATSLAGLKDDLDASRVQRVELIRVSEDVFTRTQITPETLAKYASFTVMFRDNLGKRFMPLLKVLSSYENLQPQEVRWGVIFYIDGDKKVEIYSNSSGTAGFCNGKAVRFKTDIQLPLQRLLGTLK